MLLYSQTSDATQVNKARQKLLNFIKGTISLENIPPTKGALVQHVCRAILKAGYIWGQTLISHSKSFLLQLIGVGKSLRMDGFPNGQESDCLKQDELIHCGWKKSCQELCKCFRANFSCTTLCACVGHCGRQDIQ